MIDHKEVVTMYNHVNGQHFPCFMSQRASKRHRAEKEGGSYRHAISFGIDDFHSVYAREHRSMKVGSGFMAPQTRITHKSDEHWKTAASWAPLDDPNFALDPNDVLYNEAVEAPVMQVPAEVVAQQKKRSKVAVGLYQASPALFVKLISYIHSGDQMSSGKSVIDLHIWTR